MPIKSGFYKGRLGIGLDTTNNTWTSGSDTGIPLYPLDINGDIRIGGCIVDSNGTSINLSTTINNVLSTDATFSKLDSSADLNILSTGHLKLPSGTTAQRAATGVLGMLRYNTTSSQFEGYGAGNAWGSLGGVMDVDQDTKILAELNADEDKLRFYAGGNEKMIIQNSTSEGIVIKSHIIPETTEIYDLGSAGKKIRHLFLSDNSLWVGDQHRISIDTDGKMRFKKRKKNTVPKKIRTALDQNLAASTTTVTNATGKTLENMTLNDWVAYARTTSLGVTADIKDILGEDAEDYDTIDDSGVATLNDIANINTTGKATGHSLVWNGTNWVPQLSWTVSGNNVSLGATGNVGIGTTSPYTKLAFGDAGGDIRLSNISGIAATGLITRYIGKYYPAGTGAEGKWWCAIKFGGKDPNGEDYISFITQQAYTPHGERMRITGTGNVGIGNNAPSEKLEVNGKVKATHFIGDGQGLTGVSSVGSVNDLADVDTTTTAPTENQALVWDDTNNKWVPGDVASNTVTNIRGQSFFEILTQQPQMFQINATTTQTTSNIVVSWKFDSILLFHNTTVVAKMCFGIDEQKKSLPFINQIKIDIKSPDTGNAWTNYSNLSVTTNEDYNTTASLKTKTLPKYTGTPSGGINTTLSKAGSGNAFDVRVYGVNNAENYPTEDNRALVFSSVFFLVPNPPSAPIWSSEVTVGSDNSIQFYYKCVETENIDPNNANDQSAAFITKAITKYVEVSTLAYDNTVVTTEYSDTENVSNKNENETYIITLSSLRAGTKYKYKVQARNNLIETYSGFSAFKEHTAYTRLPSNNGINTTVSLGMHSNNNTSIRAHNNGSYISGNQIYINTSSGKTITPSSTSTQTIQITDPYSSTQQTTNTGYGDYVKDSTGLITLKAIVDGTTKQTISYGGFNTTPTNSGTDTSFIDTISQTDIWGTANTTKGFRLKGTFQLNTITNATVVAKIGAAQKTAHVLKYEYDRHADVGGSDTSNSHNIYVDTLASNPNITYTTSKAIVTDVKYTMGIASVYKMTITIKRTYTGCNSVHGFIIGNGIVGKIGSVSKTTYSGQNKTISTSATIDVATPGSYIHEKATTGVYYTQAFTNGMNNSLSETSYSYNLKGSKTGTSQNLVTNGNSQTLNHFYDHNSYSSYSNGSSELTLTNIYEITDATITKFASDMGSIATQAYSNHTVAVKDWTLLYINGGWRTNENFTYPQTDFYGVNYDLVDPVAEYDAGETSYNTAGSDTGNADNGYKWFCKKFSMPSDKSSHNVGGAITDYLNVYNKLTGMGFGSTLMGYIKDATNSNAIGFIQQTVGGAIRIGNLGRALKSTALWYEQTGAVSWSTQDTTAVKANYGCVYEASSTAWGPILDTINGADDIYIFIGLKNNVSLS